MDFNEYKVVLMGKAAAGKTRWLKQAESGKRNESYRYHPTLGVEVHPVVYEDKQVVLNFWDTAGNPKFGGLRDGYYIGADLGVFVYNDEDYEDAMENYRIEFQNIAGSKPVLVISEEEMYQPGFEESMLELLGY